MILLFFDLAKAGLLKNVQNYFIRCFRSREMSKTKVGTFFKTPYINNISISPHDITVLNNMLHLHHMDMLGLDHALSSSTNTTITYFKSGQINIITCGCTHFFYGVYCYPLRYVSSQISITTIIRHSFCIIILNERVFLF